MEKTIYMLLIALLTSLTVGEVHMENYTTASYAAIACVGLIIVSTMRVWKEYA